jgi:hypothetical protein
MYSFVIARDNEHELTQGLNVNGVLIADQARYAREIHCNEYDLGGGTEGIIEFKRRMGARKETFANVTADHFGYKAAFLCWEGLTKSRKWWLS